MKNLVWMVIFFASSSLMSLSAVADDKCTDLLLNFVDETSVNDLQNKDLRNRNVTAIIPCENDAFSSTGPTPTTLHFVEHSENKLCVSQRTCGNVQAWWGYFGVAVGWSDLTLLRDFWVLSKSSRIKTNWNGYQLVGTFAVAGGQIERDCSPLSPPTCVETSTSPKK